MRTPLLSTLALLVFVCAEVSYAQEGLTYSSPRNAVLPEWTKLMYSSSRDAGEIIASYEAYYETHPFIQNEHTQYYHRWLRSLARELPPLKKPRNHNNNSRMPAQWQSIGPWDWDHEAADRSYAPGAAHVYTAEQAASNPDIIYAGTATAGVWKSMDRGLSWSPLTDQYRTASVTALEINHLQPNTVYAEILGGIYKSTNGGVSWNATGSAAFQSVYKSVHDIVMRPGDTSMLFAATSAALYKTSNGGITWTSVVSGDFLEVEFHPTRPDTIYAVRHVGDKTEFLRSLNNGATFSVQSTGWPNPNTASGEHQRRVEIAVSPAAPDKVFALATGSANGGSGLFGVYVSNNAGASWTFQCCGPQPAGPPSAQNKNLMGWNDDGTDDGGQYYYDLAFAASPTNADSLYVAGVNLWVSGNGGASFVCPAKWSHPYKPNYVHADIHDIHFYPGTHEIWLACDGGIFWSPDNGANFTRRMTGISGTDFWGLGMGFWDGEVILGGTYHNGTLLKDNAVYLNNWISTDGGDNFRGYVNPGKPKEAYTDYNIKALSGNRLINNGTRPFVNKPNASYVVGESSDMLFHPLYFGTWFSGSGNQLWKTTDDGYTFTMLHDFGEKLAAMDISLSDPDVIYVCTWPGWWSNKNIYRSDDGGSTWNNITPSSATLNGNAWVPYDIAVDAADPMKVWIVRTSMYADTDLNGYSVFSSSDGGAHWQSLSSHTIDDEAFTCIMHQAGTNGGVYLGTRESVYYRNNVLTDWEWFGQDLPAATFSTRLIPYYKQGKLRNGTNRSVWESPFFEPSSPIACPSLASHLCNCLEDTVRYMDHSIVSEQGATWFWEFPGGTPATSTERNPKVTYAKPGIYDVMLTVSDIHGSDSYLASGMLEVRNQCGLDTVPGKAIKCTLSPDYVNVPNLGVSGNTWTISAWVRPTGIQSDYTGIVMSDGTACGLNFREGNNTLGYHWAGSSQSWSWDSNLEVPPNQWSYVAMVVSPTSVKLYVNGVVATHNIVYPSVTLGTMKIGSYQAWQNRNYNGLIDEVCIWNRSLSTAEIRAMRHLTKVPANDPQLLAYYQFNEEVSSVYDKAHMYDGIINGNAQRVKSRAPIGSGVSQSKNILAVGSYEFANCGLTLSFPVLGVAPIGEVYVSRLNILPDTVVAGTVPLDHGYWIIDNYGINLQITAPSALEVADLSFISDVMQDSLNTTFYFRSANAESSGWQPGSTQAGAIDPGILSSVTFNNISSGFTTLGQVLAVRDSMKFGRPQVTILQMPDTSVSQRGGSSLALSVKSLNRGLLLPRYTTPTVEAIPSPMEGSVVFISDQKEMAFFDGTHWQIVASEYLEPPVYAGLPQNLGVSLGGGSTASAILSLGNAAGVLVLSEFNTANLLDIDFPKEGLLLYRSDLHRITYYDGIDWLKPALSILTISANTAPAQVSLPGIRIGEGIKDPNALLHILDAERGLGLPQVRMGDVLSPQAGLIIFDPDMKMLCLFDGVGWKMLKH